jgi:hypothetical protein
MQFQIVSFSFLLVFFITLIGINLIGEVKSCVHGLIMNGAVV